MKYMLLLTDDPQQGAQPGTHAHDEEMQAWFAYTDALVKAGAMVGGEALHGPETATTVTVRDGGRVVTDGPFIESKEVLGGYYIIDVPDLDTAIDWAARTPNVRTGSVEIRPVMDLGDS
ncbi:MAG TPA: YciI family protein [Ornithinimicrobium sp.]|uniref:YciI family protein n=1 Tax=Ornithinimicrobium sp. TaxID=1977084 RepID=UPI002B482D34|nr:YciI family protein [Ornithinimicrobium sp.]HKJ11864.1 YciI family protein [Ornithinimicrobium sp.]